MGWAAPGGRSRGPGLSRGGGNVKALPVGNAVGRRTGHVRGAKTPGTVAPDPFDLGTSAAISGMGGASAAAPGGLWSLGFNPAGLADINEPARGNLPRWLEGTRSSYGAVALPPGFAVGQSASTRAPSAQRLGFLPDGIEKVSDFGAMAGYGTRLPGGLSREPGDLRPVLAEKLRRQPRRAPSASTSAAGTWRYGRPVDGRRIRAEPRPLDQFETAEEDKQPMTMAGGPGWMMKKADSQMARFGLMADVVKPNWTRTSTSRPAAR